MVRSKPFNNILTPGSLNKIVLLIPLAHTIVNHPSMINENTSDKRYRELVIALSMKRSLAPVSYLMVSAA
jgi:hypothetical protein